MVAFNIALFGYDRVRIDMLLQRADEALASTDLALRAQVHDELTTAKVPVTLRGYNRGQVDAHRHQLAGELAAPPAG